MMISLRVQAGGLDVIDRKYIANVKIIITSLQLHICESQLW